MKNKEELVKLGLTDMQADDVVLLEKEMFKRAVKFQYRKKDNSLRDAVGTLDRKQMMQADGKLWEPAGEQKPEEKHSPWFKYFDLDAQAWRQFNVFNLVAMEV